MFVVVVVDAVGVVVVIDLSVAGCSNHSESLGLLQGVKRRKGRWRGEMTKRGNGGRGLLLTRGAVVRGRSKTDGWVLGPSW